MKNSSAERMKFLTNFMFMGARSRSGQTLLSTTVIVAGVLILCVGIFLFIDKQMEADPSRRSVILISVDGLKPEHIFKADELGLKIPHLRKLLAEGTHATRVRGILPTSTIPSHITLITGVSPRKHGVYYNRPFDPLARRSGDRWDWLSEHIQVPTLWNVAAKGGLRVGAVGWPGSVGAGDIHYNIPERVVGSTDEDVWSVVTSGLIDAIGSVDTTNIRREGETAMVGNDRTRMKYASKIIRQKGPDIVAVHLAGLDNIQHRYGPFDPRSLEVLEIIDAMVGELVLAMRETRPESIICVLSDHGFSDVTRVLRLDAAFEREGLLTFEERARTFSDSTVGDWKAATWPTGGGAAVFLKDPDDQELRVRVHTFLKELAEDPENGIASILDRKGIEKLGGAPDADFWVDLQPGVSISQHLDGALATSRSTQGTHGYSPTHREMDSFFLLSGDGIPAGFSLGEIDMRNIAPTIASLFGLSMETAELPALDLMKRE